MIGQGRPSLTVAPPQRTRRWPLAAALRLAVLALGALVFAGSAAAADLDVRLRVVWVGGPARSWQGTIRLSAGMLSDPLPLGLEPDTPGSMHLIDSATLQVFPRTPRNYDGVDLRIQAPADAVLTIELSAPDLPPLDPIELPLARAIEKIQENDLDAQGNRLLAQRSPGDGLRVTLSRDSLVFAPGEKLELDVEPNNLGLSPNTTYLLEATLLAARSDEQISTEDRELKTDDQGNLAPEALAIPLSMVEGVYDLRLALYPKRLTTSLVRGKPVAQRKVQVVAIAPVKPLDRSPAEWRATYELDPANPGWWKQMARLPSLRRIPNLAQQLSGGKVATREHLDRPWIELKPQAWQAYPLTIKAPGQPHILEVEYASDRAGALGISLVEPNAAGRVQPIGLDSGVEISAPEPGHKPQIKRHRLVFWPRTTTPWVLLTNRHDDRPVLFGKIDVLSGPAELPAVALPPTGVTGRTFAAYVDRLFLAENFSAEEAIDPATERAFDDWVTFYQAGRRLVEALQHGGYNAVVLSAVHDGCALYPSQQLEPTPRHDTGVFFESGQDPLRKDVLELIFRLCDRAGIQVIPAVQFSTPLPALEAIRLFGGGAAEGLEPFGPDGNTWIARHGSRRGVGVYYNALDERVQQAMQSVVDELAQRYGRHAAFGGVAVQWSADSYSVLPDATCSYDDATIGRFLAEEGLALPASNQPPLVARSDFLQGKGAAAWQAWRSQRLTTMYRTMQTQIAGHRASAKLYLLPTHLLAAPQLQEDLRPRLPPIDAQAESFARWGLDIQQLAALPGIVVPRPQRLAAGADAGKRDLLDHWNQSAEIDALFASAGGAAAIHFHEPAQLQLPAFDKVSPFGAGKTQTWLVAQISPAEALNRRRLVHSLARLDSTMLIDGGWLLPLGQEAALLPFVKVFRRLPAARFATAQPKGDAAGRGVAVRTFAHGDKTYFYVVNDTPWPAKISIDFGGTSLSVQSYAEERPTATDELAGGIAWTVTLDPYDLAGGEVAGGAARVVDYRVTFAGDPAKSLDEEIRDVLLRANSLRDPRSATVLSNPSFETTKTDSIPGWVHAHGPGMTVEIDERGGFDSPRSLHLVNRAGAGGDAAPVWVRSEPFDPPVTGRISIRARIRVADPRRQPQLRLAIEGKRDGQAYYRHVLFEAAADGRLSSDRLEANWTQCRFAISQLPLAGLTDLRVGFDLMSEGEVWIDDVEIFPLWFEQPELDELVKSIGTAGQQLDSGELPDCQRFIEGYWPSFLRRHVPRPNPRPAPAASKPPAATAAKPAATAPQAETSSTWGGRMKSWLPSSWR
ncbi:MAG: hypothetical protein WD872_09100 [Pirellulaceae bacterium]